MQCDAANLIILKENEAAESSAQTHIGVLYKAALHLNVIAHKKKKKKKKVRDAVAKVTSANVRNK